MERLASMAEAKTIDRDGNARSWCGKGVEVEDRDVGAMSKGWVIVMQDAVVRTLVPDQWE